MSKYKITQELLDKAKQLYPDAEVFKSSIDEDYIYIRRKHNKSQFYKDNGERFTIDITSTEKLHVAEVILEINEKCATPINLFDSKKCIKPNMSYTSDSCDIQTCLKEGKHDCKRDYIDGEWLCLNCGEIC